MNHLISARGVISLRSTRAVVLFTLAAARPLRGDVYCCSFWDGTGRSTTEPQNPIIISSHVWSPHFTSFVGSGL